MKLRLYHRDRTRSDIVRDVLQRTGLPHELVHVGDLNEPVFRALSPMGVVPVLCVDGVPILETVAQLLFLADLRPDLLPPVGSMARARAYEWLRLGDAWEGFILGEMRRPSESRSHVLIDVLQLFESKMVGPFCSGNTWTIADDLLMWKFSLVAQAGLFDTAPGLLAYVERGRPHLDA